MFPLNSWSSFEPEPLVQETKILPHNQHDTWATDRALKFTQFSEFAEFTEILFHLGKTPLFCKIKQQC